MRYQQQKRRSTKSGHNNGGEGGEDDGEEEEDDDENDDDITDTNDGGAGEEEDDDDDDEDEGEQSSASTMASFQRNMNLMATHRSRLAASAALSARLQATPSASSSQSSSSNKGKIVCELCKKEFLYPCNLNQHKQLHHSKEKPHECRVCHYRFEYVGHLQRHIRQQHESMAEELLAPAEPQSFDCNFCGESFDTKPLLTAHVQTMHRGEKPFQCDKCPATFSYKKSYETHREEHYLTELEMCRICVTESVGQCGMDDVVDAERCLSLTMMLTTMFPTTFGQETKPVEGMDWPTKACLACKEKVLVAYELYAQLVDSEEWLQRYAEERMTVEVETVKSEQDCSTGGQYDVLIEYTFEDGNAIYTEEAEHLMDETGDDAHSEPEPIAAEEEETAHEASVTRRSTRKRNIVQVDVPAKRRTRNKIKREPVEEDDETGLEQSGSAQDSDSRRKSDAEEESTAFEKQPRKRGRKPAAKARSVNTPSEHNEEEVREKQKRAKIKASEAADDSSDQVEELQSKVDVYQCQLCDGHVYGSPMQLTAHLKAEHPDQIRTCDKCPKVFMSEPAYQHHQYCHATLRSFFCMFCDKGFQTENLLKSHTRSHTHVAEFLCSLCGKKFNSKSNLRQHLVRHTGVKAWACTQCPSRFCTKGALNLHQRTHSTLRPFSCDTCGSQFHTRYSLIKHQLIHTGERPYGCDLCPMRYVVSHY
uniref:C2H2-type domain-containing protein n=1 Tax=Anopheles stephensi TaxID=30069 RepID=A0A182Y9L3_ANOST